MKDWNFLDLAKDRKGWYRKKQVNISILVLESEESVHAPIYAFLVQLGETTILLSLEKLGPISMTSPGNHQS